MNASLRIEVQERARQGWSRVRVAWFPVVQAAAAGAIAYVIAHDVLGHPYPFFAPVASWVALGFSRNREVRRVAELAVGVAIGVGAGDLVVHVIGSGWWQMALVLIASALVARFLDRGLMLTTQAGVQAIVIVGLPTASGGPVGRWIDALLGGAMALAVTVLTPTDVRRRPRELARGVLQDLGRVLHELARGLSTGSADRVEDALVRGRASQPALDEWLDATRYAHDLARVSPAARRHRAELARLVDCAVLTDRAVRNSRVLARRAGPVVEDGTAAPTVARDTERVARAVDELADAFGSGRDPVRARADLLAVAHDLDPHAAADEGWQAQSLVLLLRSLVVDVLQVSGADPAQAHEVLPEL